MKQLLKAHPKLRGFAQHGVLFVRVVGTQAIGTCPFCDKEKKFYASHETKAWDCKRCGKAGGFPQFLEFAHEQNVEMFKGAPVLTISKNRKLTPKALRAWGVGWNGVGYTVPMRAGSTITDLRRYVLGPSAKTINTSGGKGSLLGQDNGARDIWLCEGEWDGIALWEAFSKAAAPPAVMAVGGAGSFPQQAISLFQDRNVNLVFDNDSPGEQGMERTGRMLEGTASKILYIQWPSGLPEGYDVRDLYQQEGAKLPARLKTMMRGSLGTVHQKQEPAADDDTTDGETVEIILTQEGKGINGIAKEYQRWLHLPNAEILSVIFGAILANRLDGEPLWVFLVGPPGSAKSELLMSLSTSPNIMTTTSLTPHSLISGATLFGGGDPSLIPKLNGKVLVVKDFTTILKMNSFQRDEIFGILRDAYDGQTEKFFGNGVHRKYSSRFGFLGGVTNVIEGFSHSSSVLGERFLKYKIKQPGKIAVGRQEITRALQNIAKETKMRESLQIAAARVLTVKIGKLPELSQKYAEQFLKLAQLIAALRGVVSREKYTGEVLFKPSSEIGTRLAKQFAKLALGIALVHRKDRVDDAIFQIVCKVGQDTAPDRVEELVRQMYLRSRDRYCATADIAKWTRFPSGTCTRILQDLDLLFVVKREDGVRGSWQLSKMILRLMEPLDLYRSDKAWRKERG